MLEKVLASGKVLAVYLTEFEMEDLRRRILQRAAAVVPHNMAAGWPTRRDQVYGVLVPPELAAVEDRAGHLCRMLRMRYDAAEDAPWAFIPGREEHSVWLVAYDGRDKPVTS